MQLYPRDLGDKWHIAVVRIRALGTARVQTPPHVGKLGRIWSKGVPASPSVTAATLPMLADTSTPLIAGLGTFLGLGATALSTFGHMNPVPVFAVAAAGLYGAAIAVPHYLFARLHNRPLRRDELEAAKGAAIRLRKERERPAPRVPLMRLFQSLKGTTPNRPGDQLEQEFWTLAQDVLELGSVSATAEAEIRGVLRSLGNAIAVVPPSAYIDSDEVADALVDADTLSARAHREADPVVAESLLRQAEANVERARAQENTRRLNRRTIILRDELLAQTQAVRALLPSLVSDAATAATEFTRFAHLAASVQSVAGEAASFAAAQNELAAVLYSASPASGILAQPESAPVRLQQGQR